VAVVAGPERRLERAIELRVQELVEQDVAHEPARDSDLVEHRMDADEGRLGVVGAELQGASRVARASPAPGQAARPALGRERGELLAQELGRDLTEVVVPALRDGARKPRRTERHQDRGDPVVERAAGLALLPPGAQPVGHGRPHGLRGAPEGMVHAHA
jgi:hypothetical protein